MAVLQVNSSVLRSKADQLKQLNSKFKSACDTLDSQERSLSSMWTGDAWNVFDQSYKRNQTEFNDFYKGINDYIQALLEAAAKYEQMEQRNAQVAKGI